MEFENLNLYNYFSNQLKYVHYNAQNIYIHIIHINIQKLPKKKRKSQPFIFM